jgi:hypothetical protein
VDAHQRQQFDVLLLTAADRLAERAVQRCQGEARALHRLQTDPDGEGVWLAELVDAVFEEFCLDTPDGAAFVLAALHRRAAPPPLPPDPGSAGTVGDLLVRTAKAAFAGLLAAKVIESLSRSERYG